MIGRPYLLVLLTTCCLGLNACSSTDGNVTPVPSTGDRAQVSPAGQTAVPGVAAPGTTHAYGATGAAPAAGAVGAPPTAAAAAPLANEQIVMHTIADGDSLWKLSRQYGTSVQRIKEVNMMTTDDIFAGKTIKIPTTNPPAGVPTTPAPSTTATPPSATNPVVQPLPAGTAPPVGREPIAVPRPAIQ